MQTFSYYHFELAGLQYPEQKVLLRYYVNLYVKEDSYLDLGVSQE